MVFESSDGAPHGTRDLLVWPRKPDTPILRIADRNDNIDPLTYALLFPFGTPGWHDRLLHHEAYRTARYQRLTAGQFYTHHLMVRDFRAVLPHGAGLLFQQYILDAYCRSEAMRMAWLRQNQHQLRREMESELQDFVLGEGDNIAAPPGVPIILPSSYAGSPRNMYQLYLDAMAIVRKHGRPTYFVTFTANPQWAEIRSHLLPGQQPVDRPDLVARVFHLKLQELLRDLTKRHWLGTARAWAWTVEFQKRGLPHAYILLVVAPRDRPTTPEQVDARVVAEIPPNVNDTQRELLLTVQRCMMHGPCGARNRSAPCIQEDGSCKSGFPKRFTEATVLRSDAYPEYRRRDNGVGFPKGQSFMDNRDVVPYSPPLLKKYNAHLNVEVVSNIRLVKYIFKYAYKGHDRAHVEIGERPDEIQQHIDARYLGAAEAVWRLFEFPIHGASHTVERLSVHLPGQQLVHFVAGLEAAALRAPRATSTTLTAWFALNTSLQAGAPDPHGILQTLYQDIPLVCVWDRARRCWTPRKKNLHFVTVLGRMPAISPAAGEQYYLYLLLLSIPGATGFEDLRTIAGVLYPTFQSAAVAAGLCESDQHYHEALQDALSFATAPRARHLLATMLACCDIGDPAHLWEAFQLDLSEDLLRVCGTPALAHNAALQDIQDHLSRHGFRCSDFGLPMPDAFDYEAFRVREHGRTTLERPFFPSFPTLKMDPS